MNTSKFKEKEHCQKTTSNSHMKIDLKKDGSEAILESTKPNFLHTQAHLPSS